MTFSRVESKDEAYTHLNHGAQDEDALNATVNKGPEAGSLYATTLNLPCEDNPGKPSDVQQFLNTFLETPNLALNRDVLYFQCFCSIFKSGTRSWLKFSPPDQHGAGAKRDSLTIPASNVYEDNLDWLDILENNFEGGEGGAYNC